MSMRDWRFSAFCFVVSLITVMPALGDDQGQLPQPYDRLNLTPAQTQRIQNYDSDWRNHYMELQPRLMREQERLQNMLVTPKSDPIEINSTQQRINAIREQLGTYATSTFLRKRQVLNPMQQNQLQGWMQQRMRRR